MSSKSVEWFYSMVICELVTAWAP